MTTGNTDNGLVFAFLLDGEGGARAIGWPQIEQWTPADGCLWIHLDRMHSHAQDWLINTSDVDATSCAALLDDETRPRAFEADTDQVVFLLRGVNLNAGADPHDLISMRIWADENRLISLRSRHFSAEDDVRKDFRDKQGPKNSMELLVDLSWHMLNHLEPVIIALDDSMSELENDLEDRDDYSGQHALSLVRRQTVNLRRYIAPQREAFSHLAKLKVTWLHLNDSSTWRECSNILQHCLEDLDSIRERAAILQDNINNRIARTTNRASLLMSVIAAFFLPLTFVTGLLGINVDGIPGAHTPSAFIIVCVALAVMAFLEFLIFKLMRWL